MDRLVDYAHVAVVIAVLWGLFRLARWLTSRYLGRLETRMRARGRSLTRDDVLSRGFLVLLAGLIAMPVLTAGLALAGNRHLTGGIYLHLAMVAASVIVFSIVEDLFRLYRSYPSDRAWPVREHLARIGPAIIAFWAAGCLLLSPLFYSGLSLILLLFYLYALWCRRDAGGSAGEGG